MAPFESGRRLCVLLEAGAARFAVDATSILEVTEPDRSGECVRGTLPLSDLSELLGGPKEDLPGIAVVLDVSPTLALRVKRVREVADVAAAPMLQLPSSLGMGPFSWARGCILHKEELYVELSVDALPRRKGPPKPAAQRPLALCDEPPDRALVVESQGRLFGFALNWVSQVVPLSKGACPAWMPLPGWAGMDFQARALWPAYSLAGLSGAQVRLESFLVLTEPGGQAVSFAANKVLGVFDRLTHVSPAAMDRGWFSAPGLTVPALFLDLPHMFS